jgi:hypothetical protein
LADQEGIAGGQVKQLLGKIWNIDGYLLFLRVIQEHGLNFIGGKGKVYFKIYGNVPGVVKL